MNNKMSKQISPNTVTHASTLANIYKYFPLIILSVCGFTFNTSEFIPIGLLSDIAHDFSISEPQAGMLITVYAWVVMIASLPLMMIASKFALKKLLLTVVGLFVLSHVLSTVSTTFATLMTSRIGVACAHAIFWSIASPLAVKIAPDGKKSLGLSMMVAATSVAMVVGLPLGRIVGLYVGWRTTFLCIAVISAILFILLTIVFPKIPASGSLKITELPKLMTDPVLGGIFLMTAIAIIGHYSAYSYIEPYLGQVAKLSPDAVTIALTVFGGIGIIGSFIFSKLFSKYHYFFNLFAVFGIALFIFLLKFGSGNLVTLYIVLIGWGLAITAYNLVYQYEIIKFAPNTTAIAMSIYSGIYNLGIGGGAIVGGLVIDNISIAYTGFVGCVFLIVAGIYLYIKLLPRLKAVAD